MTKFTQDYICLMAEWPINEHLCDIKRPIFDSKAFYIIVMCSKRLAFQ